MRARRNIQVSSSAFNRTLPFPFFLIGTPNEPVVLIEYQAKCNYGWNSCFVGANNLPWHGTHSEMVTRG